MVNPRLCVHPRRHRLHRHRRRICTGSSRRMACISKAIIPEYRSLIRIAESECPQGNRASGTVERRYP